MPERGEVGFRTAIGDHDVLGVRTGIERGDVSAQLLRPVRLAVAEQSGFEERLPAEFDEVAEGDGMHSTFREVEGNLILVRGLPSFHYEIAQLRHLFSAAEREEAKLERDGAGDQQDLPRRGSRAMLTG